MIVSWVAMMACPQHLPHRLQALNQGLIKPEIGKCKICEIKIEE